MAGEIKGLGDSSSMYESIGKLEDEIKNRKKQEEESKVDDKKTFKTINKITDLIGKNNIEATKLLTTLINQNKITTAESQELITQIKESQIKQDNMYGLQEEWLKQETEKEKEREFDRIQKEKELSLWNVLRSGIQSLIPDNPAKAKEARAIYNTGIKLLGKRFFETIKKAMPILGKYIKAGLQFFGQSTLWTLVLTGILALLDPSGKFIDAIIRGIQYLTPVILKVINKIIKKLPEIFKTMMTLAKKIFNDLLPEIGKSLDKILSALFGKDLKIFEPLAKALGDIMKSLMKAVIELLPIIAMLLKDVLPIVVDLIKAVIMPLLDMIKILLPPIIDLVKALLPALSAILKAVIPILKLLITKVITPLLNFFVAILTPIIDMITHFADLLTGIFTLDKDMILGALKGMVLSYLDFLKIAFTKLFIDLPKYLFKALKNNKLIKAIADPIIKLFKKIFEPIQNLLSPLMGFSGKVFDALSNHPIIQTVKGFFDSLKQKFIDLVSYIKQIDLFKVIKDFMFTLKEGFLNTIRSIGGFFSYLKNRGITGIAQDIATGQLKTQIQAQTIKNIVGVSDLDLDLAEIAKLEVKKTTTQQTIPILKGEYRQRYQQTIKEAESKLGRGEKLEIDTVMKIIKDLALLQQKNEEEKKKLVNNTYSGLRNFDIQKNR